MTWAPAATPSWIAAVPTALAPPRRRAGLAGLQLGPLVQGEVAEVERQGERGRLDVVELGRRVEHAVAATSACSAMPPSDWSAMPTTRRPIHSSAPSPAGVDHPAHVHAERERRLGHHRGHAAAAAGDVAEVQRRGGDRDAHLARPRLRLGDVLATSMASRGGPCRTTRTARTGAPGVRGTGGVTVAMARGAPPVAPWGRGRGRRRGPAAGGDGGVRPGRAARCRIARRRPRGRRRRRRAPGSTCSPSSATSCSATGGSSWPTRSRPSPWASRSWAARRCGGAGARGTPSPSRTCSSTSPTSGRHAVPGCDTPHAWVVGRRRPAAGRPGRPLPGADRADLGRRGPHLRPPAPVLRRDVRRSVAGGERPPARLRLDLATLWRLASGWYAGRMERGYVRREPVAARDYFREVGLPGPFWGL